MAENGCTTNAKASEAGEAIQAIKNKHLKIFVIPIDMWIALTWIFSEKWMWIIILGIIAIITIPLITVWIILKLPPALRLVATILIILGWGIAAGYRDWVLSKRREAEGGRGSKSR